MFHLHVARDLVEGNEQKDDRFSDFICKNSSCCFEQKNVKFFKNIEACAHCDDSRTPVWGRVDEKLFKFRAEIHTNYREKWSSFVFQEFLFSTIYKTRLSIWKYLHLGKYIFIEISRKNLTYHNFPLNRNWSSIYLYIYQRERLENKFRNIRNCIIQSFAASWLSRWKIYKRTHVALLPGRSIILSVLEDGINVHGLPNGERFGHWFTACVTASPFPRISSN